MADAPDTEQVEDETLDHEVDPDLRQIHEINEWLAAIGEQPI